MNNHINEIYVPYSFEELNMKHTDSKKVYIYIYILNLLLDVLSFKKDNDTNRISNGWMNMSTISNNVKIEECSIEEYYAILK